MSERIPGHPSNETASGKPEGLTTFGIGSPSKYELQKANDLFLEYRESKDPRTLGKLNSLRLDAMKNAAEAEFQKLDPPRTRAQVEGEMDARRIGHEQANDYLAYILVTYLRNVENLQSEREKAVKGVVAEASAATQALRAEVAPGKADEQTRTQENPKPGITTTEARTEPRINPTPKPAADSQPRAGGEAAPKAEASGAVGEKFPVERITRTESAGKPAAEKPKSPEEERRADHIEKLNRAFMDANAREIGTLILKIGNQDEQKTLSGLIKNYRQESIVAFQKAIGMPAKWPNRTDGIFGWRTLKALELKTEGKSIPEADLLPKKDGAAKSPANLGTERWAKPRTIAEAKPDQKNARNKPEPSQEEKEAAENMLRMEIEREQNISDSLELQRKVVRGLEPAGKDVYVANSSLFATGKSAAFRFDATSGGWQWLDSPNVKDPTQASRWRPVGDLAEYTKNGVTSIPNFRFGETGQKAVNAILESAKFAKERGVPLQSPNTPSKMVSKIPV